MFMKITFEFNIYDITVHKLRLNATLS